MDHYNSKFPLLFAPKGAVRWAITLGQRTWYSAPRSAVNDGWHRHEDCHKRQFKSEGWLRFCARYLWQLWRVGYLNIDYEIEARSAERG